MSRKLLIVDDEETIRWALRELFMDEGWEVQCAGDGDEGALMLEKQDYDYMITDLKMDGLSGTELARRAHEQNPEIGITVLTGYGTVESAQEAVRVGVWDYRTKPCDVGALKQRVEEFMEKAAPSETSSSPHQKPAGAPDFSRFLRGEATDLFSGTEQDPEELLTKLRRVLTDLGFQKERATRFIQGPIEALARCPEGPPSCRTGLCDGRLMVALQCRNGCPEEWEEVAESLHQSFGTSSRQVEENGQTRLIFYESI